MVSAYADLHPFRDPLTWATKRNLTEQHLTSMGDVQVCPSQSCSKAWAGLGITFSGGRRMPHCSICCSEQRVCHTSLHNTGAQYVPLTEVEGGAALCLQVHQGCQHEMHQFQSTVILLYNFLHDMIGDCHSALWR
jgi:hypothetical protein